ncbi:MAG: hypothetical protein JNN07_05755 [Verrucomicrobiales bacterium]|nr:hypothetical protein [Verrucomicrobiales bacterium]
MSQHQLSISTPFRDARMKRPTAPGDPASEAVERAAYERGRQDAEKSMREQLLTQRSELSAIQRGLFESLRKAVTEVVQQSESLLVELSIEVAGKLVADIPLSPGSVASTVREALAQVEGTTEITVQLHPDDLALLEQVGEAERPGLPGVDAVRLVAAPHVSRGGCLVQTRFGVIDNQRETKLRNLRETLSS